MKFVRNPLFLVLALLATAVYADEVVLNSGQTLSGIILKTDGKSLTLQMKVGDGQAEVPYPFTNIKVLSFSKDAETQKLLETTETDDLPRLQQLWEKRLPYLGMAASDTGEVGLRLGRLLLAKKTKKAATEAVAIAQVVEQGDWLSTRKNEASRLRLSALAASGKVEQAIAEAEKFQNISGADESSLAAVRVQARLVQAELAASKWQALEKEWPKWKMMPEKRKERTQLLNQALDGFLFPAVFQPDQTRLCAEGLYRAAEIQMKLGDLDAALLYANEILGHYPDPEFKTKAEKLIKENKTAPDKKST